ncbi:hydrogenase expression/formation protein HypE [Geosporobacter ferrireducens]|uniref:Hydrogenase expression/formation protein HypE n=1 Tax=Geosporobacter ferrireducens TaxID=1424294 RepID=A0A1D8GEU2_9FIRM|nr:hydrogenase expression/formation protein HypE [Geosporobacter ferrireducens]AOT69423.1 hydrogenase expression/formation protein HypE [Geosporobacter ferrireducens]MTI56533.1 hydrogenase expression/formation protein HypE [Geosporobacter ferrireducens]
MEKTVMLRHGDGGKHTSILIKDIFYKHFHNDMLVNSLDASVFDGIHGRLAFTTDSFVVKPLVFPGGNIGKLAVCGTINDLVAAGARSLYLSCGFIIEEGFDMELLERIAASIGETCRKTGVKIITGDTKVVEKGSVDGVFINTSGIGVVQAQYQPKPIQAGDQIIITGGIAQHGTTIAVERYGIKVEENIKSDCRPLNHILEKLQTYMGSIKLMKDPTRGGLATALNEILEASGRGIQLLEEAIPIAVEVKSINELLGLDPLYHACEGRLIIVVDKQKARAVLEEIWQCEDCEDAAIIGSFLSTGLFPKVVMETVIGGRRIVGPLEGDMLPRIC